MKKLLTAVAVAAFCLPGAAFAQQTPGTSTPGLTSQQGGSGGMATQAALGEDRAIIGQKIKNQDGDELGEITGVSVDRTGQVRKVLLQSAEDDKKVELDWNRVTFAENDEIRAQMSKNEVADLPEHDDDK